VYQFHGVVNSLKLETHFGKLYVLFTNKFFKDKLDRKILHFACLQSLKITYENKIIYDVEWKNTIIFNVGWK